MRRGLVSHPDPRRRAKVVTKAGLETSLANTSVMPKGKRPKRPLPLGSRPSDSTIVDPTSPKVFGPKGSIVNSGIGREGNSIPHGPNQADLDKRSGRPNPSPNPKGILKQRTEKSKPKRPKGKAKGTRDTRVKFSPEVNTNPDSPHATITNPSSTEYRPRSDSSLGMPKGIPKRQTEKSKPKVEPNGKVRVRHDADKSVGSDRADPVRAEVRETLADIRSLSTIERAMEQYRSTLPAYSIFEQATGGCLGTIAAANAGFRHLGGSEDLSTPVGKAKGDMFQELTNRRCFHDARQWEEWEGLIPKHFDYYKAGMPCPDYAALGKKFGCKGNKGGGLFILQLLFIEHKLPKMVCLEMVPSALDTNGGDEVKFVLAHLTNLGYTVHADIIKCWEHGDPSHRQRLFIIGMHDIVASQTEWAWPEPVFDNSRYPIARDTAVPDDEVPEYYRRHDRPNLITDRSLDPKPGRIQHIGYAGDKAHSHNAGYSTMPNNIQGWDGIAATQLGTNGGSRRVMLKYILGEPIGDTRLTVPIEACRYASLHEESYMSFARKYYPGKKSGLSQDQWLFELVFH